jgi:hypothetical protein
MISDRCQVIGRRPLIANRRLRIGSTHQVPKHTEDFGYALMRCCGVRLSSADFEIVVRGDSARYTGCGADSMRLPRQ